MEYNKEMYKKYIGFANECLKMAANHRRSGEQILSRNALQTASFWRRAALYFYLNR